MGVNTLPPGAPRSSSVLGLEQGLRSERVKSLNRRDRVFSRASRSPRTGWAFPEGFRRAQRCEISVALLWSIYLRVSDLRT